MSDNEKKNASNAMKQGNNLKKMTKPIFCSFRNNRTNKSENIAISNIFLYDTLITNVADNIIVIAPDVLIKSIFE